MSWIYLLKIYWLKQCASHQYIFWRWLPYGTQPYQKVSKSLAFVNSCLSILLYLTTWYSIRLDVIPLDWTAVKRNAEIPWDLERTPLQIKTVDSTLGGNDQIYVQIYGKDNSYINAMGVQFSSPMKYLISYCSTWTDLPVQPPEEAEKVWAITKTATAVIVTCNGVEVLNFLFADSSKDSCVTRVGGGDVEQIEFHRIDKASDFYTCE